jgi:hypothetical protein
MVGERISGLIACISAFFSAFSWHRDLAPQKLAFRQQLSSFKFFTMPTASFRVLFVIVALAHYRRRSVTSMQLPIRQLSGSPNK